MMNIQTIINEATSHGLLEGYIYIALTDKLVFEKYDYKNTYNVEDEKILECRIFNKKGEYKAIKSVIGEDFRCRYIDENICQDVIEEKQFLDIDTTKCEMLNDGTYNVKTTGGGSYHLPFNKIDNTKIIIHNYVDYYPETGQAYICDYRLVDLGV